jgi:homoserine O-acetyltransferase/O-succinyltransferase
VTRHRAAFLASLLCVAATPGLSSQATQAPQGHDFVIRNFKFADGETLPELRIHYITLGTLRKDAAGRATNAVLILHGTTGAGTQFLSGNFAGVLYGPGQTLDTTRYFIVLPDGVGHGKSSKPSDGMHARFPKYTYDDMVDAQHRLLTDALGVSHLRLVMGTSMGGMHTWVWGERYPDFMDALVPLASVPTQIAGRNRMMRAMIMDAIRDDPDYRGGEYATQPRGLRTSLGMLFMMTSSPLTQHRSAPTRDAADKQIRDYIDSRMRTMDANDVLYAFNASRDYDPSTQLEKIRAPLLAINSADDVVNPPELGLMEKLMPRVAHGRYVLIPTSEATRGHGTHTMAAVWGSQFADFLRTVP